MSEPWAGAVHDFRSKLAGAVLYDRITEHACFFCLYTHSISFLIIVLRVEALGSISVMVSDRILNLESRTGRDIALEVYANAATL